MGKCDQGQPAEGLPTEPHSGFHAMLGGTGQVEDSGVSWATSMCSVATAERRTQRTMTGRAMRSAGARLEE